MDLMRFAIAKSSVKYFSLLAWWYRVCLQCWRSRSDRWGREDPLEEEMATHSSILVWDIPWTEEPGLRGFCKESDTTE